VVACVRRSALALPRIVNLLFFEHPHCHLDCYDHFRER
jgi:hypothetical protein